jgi:hypothetical protein
MKASPLSYRHLRDENRDFSVTPNPVQKARSVNLLGCATPRSDIHVQRACVPRDEESSLTSDVETVDYLLQKAAISP